MGRSIISVLRCGLRPGWGSDFLPSLWGMHIFLASLSLSGTSDVPPSIANESGVEVPSASSGKSLFLPRFEETLGSRSSPPRRGGARPCRLTAGRWVTTAESFLNPSGYLLSGLVGLRISLWRLTLSVRASEFTDIFSDFLSVSITLFFDLGSNALEIFGSDMSDSLSIFSFELPRRSSTCPAGG